MLIKFGGGIKLGGLQYAVNS